MFNKLFGKRAATEPSDPVPQNALEARLAAVIGQTGELGDFVRELLASQVFILAKGEPDALTKGAPIQPLVVTSTNGYLGAALFTTPERSLATQQANPEYKAGLAIAFTWVLSNVPDGLGLVINPGSGLCIEQPAEGVAQLKRDFASGAIEPATS